MKKKKLQIQHCLFRSKLQSRWYSHNPEESEKSCWPAQVITDNGATFEGNTISWLWSHEREEVGWLGTNWNHTSAPAPLKRPRVSLCNNVLRHSHMWALTFWRPRTESLISSNHICQKGIPAGFRLSRGVSIKLQHNKEREAWRSHQGESKTSFILPFKQVITD